jgi:hypothetical protein
MRPDIALRTCSYGEFKPWMGLAVRISLGQPRFWPQEIPESRTVPELQPRGWYLRADPTEFERAYQAQLARYGVDAISARLETISREFSADVLVLCCFEVLTKSACHRRDFASWWHRQTGESVEEMGEQPPTS